MRPDVHENLNYLFYPRRAFLGTFCKTFLLLSAITPPLFAQLDLGEVAAKKSDSVADKKKGKSKKSLKKDKNGENISEDSSESSEIESAGSEETEPADSKEKTKDNKCAPRFTRPTRSKYRIGLSLEARPNGECNEVFGSVPFPMDFPDQKVRIIEDECPDHVRMKYRDLKEGGCRQLLIRMRTLSAGEKAEAVVTVEVTRFDTAPPETTEALIIPKPVPKEVKEYLRESPFIEIANSKVKKAAKESAADTENDWKKAEKILHYVRDKVKYKEAYKEKAVRGALAALETGEGDCEDMSTLFIALCRINGIPARTVRVPEHCWAEFYMEDGNGTGFWFPAQVAGNEPLGYLTDHRLILQKGDAFRVPETARDVSRYVTELFTGKVAATGADPIHQFIREEIR